MMFQFRLQVASDLRMLQLPKPTFIQHFMSRPIYFLWNWVVSEVSKTFLSVKGFKILPSVLTDSNF